MSRRARLAATTLTSWVRDLSSVAKDRILALLLALLAVVEVVTAEAVVGSRWLQAIALVVMTASVAWRRASPVLAGAVAGAALGAQTLLGEADVVAGFVALMIVTYSAASYAPLRRALVGGAFVAGGVFVYPIVSATTFAEEAGNLAIFAGMWVLGRMVRSRQMRAVEAEARARAVEQDREERIRAVIAEERSRMARELHDIVAHGVSLMVLQAGAARQTLDTAPAAVPDLLMTIERAGRQSLDEMHRLLALLRHDDESLAPSPRLDALDGLLDDVRRAGLRVEQRIEGEPRRLPPGLEVSAYRIVQESLTNTVRHAEAEEARVVVRYDVDAVELEVTDDGRGVPGPERPAGHGLIGMRERAALFGGWVTSGPAEAGGWEVRARLPIGDPAAHQAGGMLA